MFYQQHAGTLAQVLLSDNDVTDPAGDTEPPKRELGPADDDELIALSKRQHPSDQNR